MGPFLALLDIENPAGFTQADNVHQRLGRCPATPSQYRPTSSYGAEGSGFGFASLTPILPSTRRVISLDLWLTHKL